MAVNYTLLTEEEQDLRIVETMKAQQMDHLLFTKDLERFQSMLPTLPDGDLKTKIQNEIPVLQSRIDEVESIIDALNTQMPPTQARIDAAIATINAQ